MGWSVVADGAAAEADRRARECSGGIRASNMAAATSVVVLDRGNNTTCTINLHGACQQLVTTIFFYPKITLAIKHGVCAMQEFFLLFFSFSVLCFSFIFFWKCFFLLARHGTTVVFVSSVIICGGQRGKFGYKSSNDFMEWAALWAGGFFLNAVEKARKTRALFAAAVWIYWIIKWLFHGENFSVFDFWDLK